MEIELSINNKQKSASKWRIFWFTLIVVFIVTTMQNIGIGNFKFASPIPQTLDTFEEIKPKLEKIRNDYKLKKSTNLIESSFASSSFDQSSAYAAIDLDSGEVLLEKNLSKSLPIASLTKIMTAVVALDLATPNEIFTVTERASKQIPTKIGVVSDQKMTVEELLNAILLTSANDAAQALKDGIDAKYSGEVFIKAMNEKAKFIGLKNTNFTNPQGFDAGGSYSTVEDLSILTHYALSNYALISEIVRKDYEFLPSDSMHKQFDLYNWNGLLGVYPGVSGVKIGNTERAGNTTIVVSERNGKKVLVVLLGAPGVLKRDLWASQILDRGFEKFDLPAVSITEQDLRQKYGTWKYWN